MLLYKKSLFYLFLNFKLKEDTKEVRNDHNCQMNMKRLTVVTTIIQTYIKPNSRNLIKVAYILYRTHY